MPSTLSCSSTPPLPHLPFSHLPALRSAWACGMLRAQAIMRATVCSAAVSTLLCGALTTTMPRLVASLTSTLSTPTPARPTTCSLSAAWMTSAVTLVAERMIRPW